jgi:hypothetical protein
MQKERDISIEYIYIYIYIHSEFWVMCGFMGFMISGKRGIEQF